MIELNALSNQVAGKVQLSSSKSISNRLLILSAMAKNNLKLSNLSDADDTKLLDQILSKPNLDSTIDCHHAGTTFRFLTAYLSTKEGLFKLYGSERMHQRPIAPLVDAINQIGGEIEYLEKKGFPPLLIRGKQITGGEISITGDVSSQFISALLMIAPTLKKGLKLTIMPPILSRPYIQMTLSLMKKVGIKHTWENNTIIIANQPYHKIDFTVENDWSSSSFLYSLASLSHKSTIEIPNLFKNSLQGDAFVSELYENLGVKTSYTYDGISIQKTEFKEEKLAFNLADYPDLALPFAVSCVGLGIETHLTGLESLKLKESDRLFTLQKELSKFKVRCEVDNHSIFIPKRQNINYNNELIQTHHDHRIPMSIAPLCMKVGPIRFDDEHVVNKSYPSFWKDMETLGLYVKR